MLIKLLQLNCENGRFLTKIVNFLHQNDFDIINLQEASSGNLNRYNHNLDVFTELKQQLDYQGVLTQTMRSSDGKSYFGNATLFKPEFSLRKQNVI